MSAKKFIAAPMLLALAACMPTLSGKTDKEAQPLAHSDISTQCAGKDGWSDPAPPAHVFANVYMVGTCGIVSLLITSPDGHILIDGATEQAAPLIAENIRKLGFEPRDVRYLLSSHEHIDHAGGLAALKQITGAQMLARAAAKTALETGAPDATDPQRGLLPSFPGVKVDRVVADGEQVVLGPLKLTVIATPAHSIGSTSWSWRSCEKGVCRDFVYADSLSARSSDAYRFTDHPEYVAMFRATLARVAKLPNCDILISPHPGASDFFERLAGTLPLADKNSCATYAADATAGLDKRLAAEAK